MRRAMAFAQRPTTPWLVRRQLSSGPHPNNPTINAVVFDLGGVVLTPGPLVAIRKYEKKHGIEKHKLAKVFAIGGEQSPFARLERGELMLPEFYEPFEQAAKSQGITVDAAELFKQMESLLNIDPVAIDAIQALRSHSIKVAALTNNWKPHSSLPDELRGMFDVFVESAEEGLRKPDPKFYQLCLDRLGVDAERTIFLDDIGGNLKAAKELGMHTVKVSNGNLGGAINEVEEIIGVSLGAPVRGTVPIIPSKLPFDPSSLLQYLGRFFDLSNDEVAAGQIRAFAHGQSNPTYFVAIGGKQLVIRKKPPGKLVKSAHAVDREYRVIAALEKAGVPVPKAHVLCENDSIVGTSFYVMDYTKGRVLKDPVLPECTPAERTAIYDAMNQVLVDIHSVDVNDPRLDLSDFGKQGGYVKRQLRQWSGQYDKQREVFPIPSMERLIEWLPANQPPESATTVAHGDFRLDNLILDSSESKVVAVLDWELSTLGEPMCDLAYNCMAYHLPSGLPGVPGLASVDIEELGIPSEMDYVAQYMKRRNLDHILNDPGFMRQWDFYMAFSFFRIAAILQGVYVRSLKGQSSSDNARAVGSFASTAADIGWWIANGRVGDPGDPPATGTRKVSTSTPSPTDRRAMVDGLKEKVKAFIEHNVMPHEAELAEHARGESRWEIHPLQEEMKQNAKDAGLWNLFLPDDISAEWGGQWHVNNEEYAELCEIMGRSLFAPEAFNCSAPDTGNMEVLARYGTSEQKEKWLKPLLEGTIRSCFAMTEPAVASSDATNIQSSIQRDGDDYILNGRKWWTSGAMDPRCSVAIFMGKTDTSAAIHQQQSMVIVPMDAPGIKILRPLMVLGFDDAPHGHAEIEFDNVRVPVTNMLLGEGRGFEIAQGRLGPGRIHHCMRLIGMAERCHEAMLDRVCQRVAFGKPLAEQGTIRKDIALNRIEIDQCRLLTMHAARLMDSVGNKVARKEIAMIKVAAPHMAQGVIDRAMQAHGAAGLSQDYVLAHMFAWARVLRLADGPDEVHLQSIAKMELRPFQSKL